MSTLHLLGTGAAVSDAHRTTTMLACTSVGATIVVDCGGDVVQRLLASGIDLKTISALIVTHEHPDHVSGFPLFMEKIWLDGRQKPIQIYGIQPAIDQAQRVFDTFDTASWDLPAMRWNEVALEEGVTVLEDNVWHVIASPGRHAVPVVGLRITSKNSGRTIAYSCDTEPCESILRLARGANILVHEATGEGPGHSSAQQAARIARDADVERLILVHLPPGLTDDDLEAARSIFGTTDIAEELGTYEL